MSGPLLRFAEDLAFFSLSRLDAILCTSQQLLESCVSSHQTAAGKSEHLAQDERGHRDAPLGAAPSSQAPHESPPPLFGKQHSSSCTPPPASLSRQLELDAVGKSSPTHEITDPVPATIPDTNDIHDEANLGLHNPSASTIADNTGSQLESQGRRQACVECHRAKSACQACALAESPLHPLQLACTHHTLSLISSSFEWLLWGGHYLCDCRDFRAAVVFVLARCVS